MEDILKDTLKNLEKSYGELGQMKDQLLSMSLNSSDYLFEGEEPVYTKMDISGTNEVLSALEKDLLPLFEEFKFEKGIKKVKEYIKLLQENLEKQK